MARIAIFLILFFTVSGAVYCWFGVGASNRPEVPAEANSKEDGYGTVVYALSNVEPGEVLDRQKLDESTLELSKVPQDAVVYISQVEGRKTKYGLSEGQLLSFWDLEPVPRLLYAAARELPAQSKITPELIESKRIDDDPRPSEGLVTDPKEVVGKLTRRKISAGETLWLRDFTNN